MIFNLSISDNLKDKLKFLNLKKAILDKKLLLKPKFNKLIMDTIIINIYKNISIDLILI